MYEQCFHFSSRPFTTTPFVKHYVAAQEIQQSITTTRLCIDRGTGPVVIIGASGTGKSLLLAMLEEQYRSQFSVVNLACARLDQRQDLLQSILFELQLPYRDMGEGELRLSLMDYLRPSESCPNGVLLLVDEAHTLPVDLLDELRLITNFVRDGQPRVRLVMAGNQRLEECLNDARLDSFNQRIAARCYLSNLSQSETSEYIRTHLERSGGEAEKLFPKPTTRKVHELTEGSPRCINQLCDHALILAATRGETSISEHLVLEAWADVQNLPGLISAHAASGHHSLEQEESWTVIEFGNLEDEEPAESSATGETDHTSDFDEHSADGATTFAEQDGVQIESNCEDLAPCEQFEASNEDYSCDGEPEETATVCDSDSPLTDACDQESFEMDANVGEESEEYQECEISESQNSALDQQPEEIVDEQSDDEPCQEQTDSLSQECENPFDEQFENEEVVVDEYTPLVAAQNQSSLNVTPEDLDLIRPLEACDSQPGGEAQEAGESNMETPAIEAADEHAAETEGHEETYYEHVTNVESDEIERQAEEILMSLSVEDDEVSCETEEMVDESLSPGAGGMMEPDTLEESHRVLQEIIEENQRVASEGPGPDLTESLTDLDTPLAADASDDFSDAPGHDADVSCRSDDRDMIIVGSQDQTVSESGENEDSIPFPSTAASTGRAERMDYQQLFEQLRTISDE